MNYCFYFECPQTAIFLIQVYSRNGVLFRDGVLMPNVYQCTNSFLQTTTVVSCCDTDRCNAAGNIQPMPVVSVFLLLLVALKVIDG